MLKQGRPLKRSGHGSFIPVWASLLSFVLISCDIHSVTLSFNIPTRNTAIALLSHVAGGQSCMKQAPQALECVEEIVTVAVWLYERVQETPKCTDKVVDPG